jgi:hypothetical protein
VLINVICKTKPFQPKTIIGFSCHTFVLARFFFNNGAKCFFNDVDEHLDRDDKKITS